LADALLARFETAVRSLHGDRLTLPLLVQFESARQRLRAVAEQQAEQRRQGWVIDKIEHDIALKIDRISVTGSVDRIERNEHDGRVRVIDYKTSDKGDSPRSTHLRRLGKEDDWREPWQRVPDGSSELIWKDLQLPLYRRALLADYGAAITCAYFTLPKAVGETAIMEWPELTGDLQAAADRCADGVVEAILAGRFSPVVEQSADWDDYAELFHRGAAASLQDEGGASA
jgi:ATP-dependent helicase/nuclease subunit B